MVSEISKLRIENNGNPFQHSHQRGTEKDYATDVQLVYLLVSTLALMLDRGMAKISCVDRR